MKAITRSILARVFVQDSALAAVVQVAVLVASLLPKLNRPSLQLIALLAAKRNVIDCRTFCAALMAKHIRFDEKPIVTSQFRIRKASAAIQHTNDYGAWWAFAEWAWKQMHGSPK
jgi:hypothetical protein